MFRCRFCSVKSERLKEHLQHRTSHSSLTNKFWCGFNGCPKSYTLESSLLSHLRRIHGHGKVAKRETPPRISDPRGKFVCSVARCKKEFDNRSTLIKHLKDHIGIQERIQCPYVRCERSYNNLNSFTSHLSKKHKAAQADMRHVSVVSNTNEEQRGIANENNPVAPVPQMVHAFDPLDETEGLIRLNIYDNEDEHLQDSCSDSFLENVAQLYLKLESQLLIPASTIQLIVSETYSTHEKSQSIVKNKLQSRLLDEGLTLDKVNNILDEIFDNDPFLKCNDHLKTNYRRKKYYQEHFSYVKPVEVYIEGNDKNKKFFHYVPLAETLTQLFDDKSLEMHLNNNSDVCDPNVLTDFTDGSVFKQSDLKKKNPDGLKLILYQDSFEVVNPIGSAVQTHKILAIYLSIGNLSEHTRSHINAIKLIALCKEKQFNHDKVYGRITDDLKKIESDGIVLPSGRIVKGAVVFVCGDNLGSHQLGGFIENFSASTYFCRYCLITRDKLSDEESAVKTYESRSIKSYDEALEKIRDNNNYQGVKFNSVFNSLANYHVCQPGLPPCLGHDLFEGVLAYDLKLLLDTLVEECWFSYDTLNKRIKSFSYSTADIRDKPCVVSPKKKRIVLRLLPLLIVDKIKDPNNKAWICILLLTEIVEISCAPKIHTSYLSYFQIIINDYIGLRMQFGLRIRPKHHFLTHYPDLIRQFGPLLKVWTMRFESKHTYLKRVLRFSRNYINVTKTLSQKHELFQSFLRAGADIRPVIELKENSNFQAYMYNEDIQEAAKMANLPGGIQECDEVVVKGTVYKKGAALIIHQDGYQYNIVVGRICILLSDEEDVFILFEILETVFRPHLRSYEVGRCTGYECLRLTALPSTEVLHIYKIQNMLYVKPSCGLVQHCL